MGREKSWLYPAFAIAMIALLCAAAVKIATGHPGQPSQMTSLKVLLVVVVLAATVRFLFYLFRMGRIGEGRPIDRIRQDFVPAALEFLPIPMGVAVLGAFFYSVTFLKSMIPSLVPFWADAALAVTDRALFIDQQALALLLAPILPALGLFYGLWHVAHLGGLLWVLHWRDERRGRHIISFMLTWSIGMAAAYVFSSMGPIFTGRFDPAIAPESVRRTAAFLWNNYQSGSAAIGGGISAFPSMHVAIAAWLAIVLRDRGWPGLGVAYLVAIFVCSIILGWHYAVDGVAGVAIALLADRMARAWLNGRQSRSYLGGSRLPAPEMLNESA